MATPKQLAALKKARAARKKNLAAKKPVNKKTPAKKVAVTAKSRVTKKAPSASLKKRRAENTKKGYFPNPVKTRKTPDKYVIFITTAKGMGYMDENGDVQTGDISHAYVTNKTKAEFIANAWFNVHGKKIKSLEVKKVSPSTYIPSKPARLFLASLLPSKKPKGTGYAKNPVPASSAVQIRDAAKLYEDFTGHPADYFDEVPVNWPKVGLKVGLCEGVLYETIRDGKVEHYIHKFKKNARPVLAASHDGKQLSLIGGKFAFTERGIVDN